jgi:signal peptidase I
MVNEQDILNSINANPNTGLQPGSEPKDDHGHQESGGRLSEFGAFIWETAKVIIISLAIIVPIRYYLVQPFFVKGASMEENFHDGDYLLVDEISYRLNEPKRGDVIIFRYPENKTQFFIKRIIGLPYETVEIKDSKVTIYNDEFPKGMALSEEYLSPEQQTVGNHFVKLNANEYFVLGDNRLQSSDSRRWGKLDKELIIGKAFIRLWPLNNITKVEGIKY